MWKYFRAGRLRLIAGLIFFFALSLPGQQEKSSGSTAAAVGTAAAAVQSSNGAQPGQPTAPTPATAQKIAMLPEPFPPGLISGIDVAGQSSKILSHLGEVVRYYRMAVAPIQKVGETSDVLYAQEVQNEAAEVGQTAFRAARGQAGFLVRIPAKGPSSSEPRSMEENKTEEILQNLSVKIKTLQTRASSIDGEIAAAKPAQRGALEDEKGDIQGQLKLYTAALGTVRQVVSTSAVGSQGLQGNIDTLQHSVPELVNNQHKAIAPSVDSVASIRDAGVVTQATVLIQLFSTESAIDERIQELKLLHDQADALRAPLIKVLTAIMAESQTIENDSGSTTANLQSKRKQYDALTDAFTTLSDVAVPASQEVLLLEQAQTTYGSWRASVSATHKTIVHALLLRVGTIALSLGIILVLGVVWRTAAAKYVHDVRRRRQILLMRRIVVGFLCGLVLIFGFVTQFSSLATFAGFITAGIAVGLQTILLSVAAYFFIVGRYGIRVGDRITVAGVTGEVVEVGLVRFYLLELTGTGTEFHSTGRIAVFANSVLFQTGTPLYKQIPGTDYAWHELLVKFKPQSDYEPVLAKIHAAVSAVYATYKDSLEKQHRDVERSMDTSIQGPGIETRIQLIDGPQYAVLYPVRLSNAAEIDQEIVGRILHDAAQDQSMAGVLDGVPSVKAVVKS